MGTLFELEAARRAFRGLGAAPELLEAWFERILHQAASLTLLGEFSPFREIAAGALRTTLAQNGLDPSRREPLEALQELDAYDDAREALRALREGGIEVAVLTNGGRQSTEHLLERAGLRPYVQHVVTVEEASRYKPDRAPYETLLQRLGRSAESVALVAAHGWDCLGARNAGLRPIWVDRLEREWPFDLQEPERVPTLLDAARLVLSGDR